MPPLLEVVALIAVVVVGAAAARRFGLLAPILLVLAGLAASLVPGVPAVELDPELVLVGVLPPLVYVAALETSVPAFRFNLRPILLLAVGLVVATGLVVGFALSAVLPGVPLAACLALGAIVAPPDAVAATAVARRIGLPGRVVTILEGESLINDATALVMLRVSVAAAVGGATGPGRIAVEALLAAGGGIAVGAAGAVLFGFAHRRTTDPLLDNALSLLTPFAVVLVAEWLGGSGVVAVVVTGLVLGPRTPTLMSAASRLQMEAFWRMVRFLLEGLVFLLVGLQLREVLAQLHTPVGTVAAATAVVLAAVVVTRFAWLYPSTYLARLMPVVRTSQPTLDLRYPTVVAWAGMRGVVTIAAAFTLPTTLAGGRAYPRDLFVWLAFAVIVVTLVLQGLTLPAVARRLRLPPDDPRVDLLAEAAVQYQASQAALRRLEQTADGAPPEIVEQLRGQTGRRSNGAWERLGSQRRETPAIAYARLRRAMLDAEREVFRAARDEGRITEQVLRRAQRDMDLEESMLKRDGAA